MLGYLRGTILSKSTESTACILLAGQVGYEILVPLRVYDQLEVNAETALWIHTHVREDALVLYGFCSEHEKQFFRVLLGVSGLGPKMALSLLSEHGAEKLTRLVLAKESDEIASAPGVGKKTAQRITLELGGKLEKLSWAQQLEKLTPTARAVPSSPHKQLRDDLSSALGNLGYTPSAVKLTLDRLFDRDDAESLGFETALKSALSELSGRTRSTVEMTGNG